MSLFLTDVCPITVSMGGSARKHGTASNALVMRQDTAGPPATTVSANLSHFNLVIAWESWSSATLYSIATWITHILLCFILWGNKAKQKNPQECILIFQKKNGVLVVKIYSFLSNDSKEGQTRPTFHMWNWDAEIGFPSCVWGMLVQRDCLGIG